MKKSAVRNMVADKKYGWITNSTVHQIEKDLLDYVNDLAEYLDGLWKSGTISCEDFRELVLKYENKYTLYKKVFRETFGYPFSAAPENLRSLVKYFEKLANDNIDVYNYVYIEEPEENELF